MLHINLTLQCCLSMISIYTVHIVTSGRRLSKSFIKKYMAWPFHYWFLFFFFYKYYDQSKIYTLRIYTIRIKATTSYSTVIQKQMLAELKSVTSLICKKTWGTNRTVGTNFRQLLNYILLNIQSLNSKSSSLWIILRTTEMIRCSTVWTLSQRCIQLLEIMGAVLHRITDVYPKSAGMISDLSTAPSGYIS